MTGVDGEKKRKTVTVDEEVYEYLQQDHINASGFLNSLAKKAMRGESGSDAMLQLRLAQIDSEIERHENQIEVLKDERESIREDMKAGEEKREEVIEEAAEILSEEHLEPTHPGVQKKAERAGVIPQTLISEIRERWRDEQDSEGIE